MLWAAFWGDSLRTGSVRIFLLCSLVLQQPRSCWAAITASRRHERAVNYFPWVGALHMAWQCVLLVTCGVVLH